MNKFRRLAKPLGFLGFFIGLAILLANIYKTRSNLVENYEKATCPIQDSAQSERILRTKLELAEKNLNLTTELLAKCNKPTTEVVTGTTEEASDTMTLITAITSEDMSHIRELVGSMHYLRESNLDVHLLIIYGFGLLPKERNEIGLWRNVEIIDGVQAIHLGQKVVQVDGEDAVSDLRPSSLTILNIIELNMRKFNKVLFVSPRVVFKRDSLHEISSILDKDGFVLIDAQDKASQNFANALILGFKYSHAASRLFVSLELQCLRGFHCDASFREELTKAQKEKLAHMKRLGDFGMEIGIESSFYCHLLLRDDVLYSFEYSTKHRVDEHPEGKTVMAIGMPTLSGSGLTSFKETAPVSIFLPSFLLTVNDVEWSKFVYRIYIGFDEGDRYFDDPSTRKKIHAELTRQVQEKAVSLKQNIQVEFEYVKFPYSRGWVTYIWNGLFVHAIKDKADYFYQVNDDLELTSSGWTTLFTDSLKNNNDFGVTGPFDALHGGGLLTQACVSKKHYDIFGRFYPLDIKDWYSDNWMNDVYGSNRFVSEQVKAINRNNQGTRYQICSKPKYDQVLAEGKRTIEDWLEDKKVSAKEKLARELKHGALIS